MNHFYIIHRNFTHKNLHESTKNLFVQCSDRCYNCFELGAKQKFNVTEDFEKMQRSLIKISYTKKRTQQFMSHTSFTCVIVDTFK
jgi:hypothetical protein